MRRISASIVTDPWANLPFWFSLVLAFSFGISFAWPFSDVSLVLPSLLSIPNVKGDLGGGGFALCGGGATLTVVSDVCIDGFDSSVAPSFFFSHRCVNRMSPKVFYFLPVSISPHSSLGHVSPHDSSLFHSPDVNFGPFDMSTTSIFLSGVPSSISGISPSSSSVCGAPALQRIHAPVVAGGRNSTSLTVATALGYSSDSNNPISAQLLHSPALLSHLGLSLFPI